MSREAVVQLLELDEAGTHEALVGFVADEVLPYFSGIEAVAE